MARTFEKLPFVQGMHTYSGSCHCGAVRWQITVNLQEGTTRCNCTYCTKTGWWGCSTTPEHFALIAGEDALVSVNPSEHALARRRCGQCGLESFGGGDIPEMGGPFVSINVRCLDGVDLEGVPVTYLDGLHDTWDFLGARPWHDSFSF